MKPLQTAIPQGKARPVVKHDLKAARRRGYNAYQEGRSPYSCTYADPEMAQAWESAWDEARKLESERRLKP